MNKILTHKVLIIFSMLCMISLFANAQENTETITDTKLKEVLQERKRLLKGGYIKNYFTIQVFSSDNLTNAKKVLTECNAAFTDRSQIFYETPNYKVQIGQYRNRLDADRAKIKIAEKYPSAFVFKPKEKK